MVCCVLSNLHLTLSDAFFLLDVAHVLPILFPFTTPGKYCHRAMALFSKHVTSTPKGPLCATEVLMPPGVTPMMDYAFTASPTSLTPHSEIQRVQPPNSQRRMSFTSGISRAASTIKRRGSLWSSSPKQQTSGLVSTQGDNSASASGYVTPKSPNVSDESVDVAGPRIGGQSESHLSGVSMAGEAKVYTLNWVLSRISDARLLFMLKQTAGQFRWSKDDPGACINAWDHSPT